RAFRESSDLITLDRITNGEWKSPSELVPNYPPELEQILRKALHVDPDQRYQDAGTMGRDLERLAVKLSLPLGHVAIADVMHSLFDAVCRGRRRFARGSSDLSSGNHHAAPTSSDARPRVGTSSDEPAESRRRALKPTTPMSK